MQAVIDFAVGDTRPDLTLLLQIPLETSEKRRANRRGSDRFESADREFFQRIEAGYAALAEAELLLMNASRAQLVREVIRPALAGGEVVLCDRFYDSTTVYQGAGRGLDAAQVQSIIDFAVGETRPDLTILLQIPIEISEKRRANRRGTDRFEFANRDFFERIEAGYAALAQSEPDRIRAINADRPLDTVQADIWTAVSNALKS